MLIEAQMRLDLYKHPRPHSNKSIHTHTDTATISGPQGGGGTLIFSHLRKLGLFLGGQSSEFQYFLGFQKS